MLCDDIRELLRAHGVSNVYSINMPPTPIDAVALIQDGGTSGKENLRIDNLNLIVEVRSQSEQSARDTLDLIQDILLSYLPKDSDLYYYRIRPAEAAHWSGRSNAGFIYTHRQVFIVEVSG